MTGDARSANEIDREKWETPPDHFGGRSDEWATPPSLLRPLADAVGGFDLDPCSGAERMSIADETYTADDNGLKQPWFGKVWCNPPYSEMEDWMRKAVNESNRSGVELVLVLAPARTSTQWFHNYGTKADGVAFLEGRLTFGDTRDQVRNAPFPSLIAVYGEYPEELAHALDARGVFFRSGQRVQRTQQTVIA